MSVFVALKEERKDIEVKDKFFILEIEEVSNIILDDHQISKSV